MANDITPEIQIQLLDLAWKIVCTTTPMGGARERADVVKERTDRLNEAYKAIIKTITV
jgi:hypothetical protein